MAEKKYKCGNRKRYEAPQLKKGDNLRKITAQVAPSGSPPK
jgi:hypothetical protein